MKQHFKNWLIDFLDHLSKSLAWGLVMVIVVIIWGVVK